MQRGDSRCMFLSLSVKSGMQKNMGNAWGNHVSPERD